MSKKMLILLIALLAVIMIGVIIASKTKKETETEEAPDFTFTTVDGEVKKLSDYRGKVVLIDFFATWCKPCEMQLEILRTLWHKYKDKIVIISIDIDPRETISMLKQYAKEKDITWVIGSSPEAGKKYKIMAIPTLVIITKSGKIHVKKIGLTSTSTLEKWINEALSKP